MRPQVGEASMALRRDDPEFRQHRPKAVHQLRALLEKQVARPLQRPRRLLRLALDRNRPDLGASRRDADRRGVARVGLVALDERVHISRRKQPHIVPQSQERATPGMRRPAGLQRHHAGRKLLEEGGQPLAAEPL
jgi:hypothetical protein